MKVEIDEVSKIVSKRTGLKESIVKEINRSQWKFLMDTMREEPAKAVKIIYLGKFSEKIKPDWTKKIMAEILLKKKAKDNG